MLNTDIGDKSTNGANITTVAVGTGDTVVISNVAGDTLNTFTQIDGAAGTIAVSANATFTVPVWLQSQGRSSVKLTGGQYGN